MLAESLTVVWVALGILTACNLMLCAADNSWNLFWPVMLYQAIRNWRWHKPPVFQAEYFDDTLLWGGYSGEPRAARGWVYLNTFGRSEKAVMRKVHKSKNHLNEPYREYRVTQLSPGVLKNEAKNNKIQHQAERRAQYRTAYISFLEKQLEEARSKTDV